MNTHASRKLYTSESILAYMHDSPYLACSSPHTLQHLVGVMGGAVTCSSAPGHGSTFDFCVAVGLVPPTATAADSPAMTASHSSSSSSKAQRSVVSIGGVGTTVFALSAHRGSDASQHFSNTGLPSVSSPQPRQTSLGASVASGWSGSPRSTGGSSVNAAEENLRRKQLYQQHPHLRFHVINHHTRATPRHSPLVGAVAASASSMVGGGSGGGTEARSHSASILSGTSSNRGINHARASHSVSKDDHDLGGDQSATGPDYFASTLARQQQIQQLHSYASSASSAGTYTSSLPPTHRGGRGGGGGGRGVWPGSGATSIGTTSCNSEEGGIEGPGGGCAGDGGMASGAGGPGWGSSFSPREGGGGSGSPHVVGCSSGSSIHADTSLYHHHLDGARVLPAQQHRRPSDLFLMRHGVESVLPEVSCAIDGLLHLVGASVGQQSSSSSGGCMGVGGGSGGCEVLLRAPPTHHQVELGLLAPPRSDVDVRAAHAWISSSSSSSSGSSSSRDDEVVGRTRVGEVSSIGYCNPQDIGGGIGLVGINTNNNLQVIATAVGRQTTIATECGAPCHASSEPNAVMSVFTIEPQPLQRLPATAPSQLHQQQQQQHLIHLPIARSTSRKDMNELTSPVSLAITRSPPRTPPRNNRSGSISSSVSSSTASFFGAANMPIADESRSGAFAVVAPTVAASASSVGTTATPLTAAADSVVLPVVTATAVETAAAAIAEYAPRALPLAIALTSPSPMVSYVSTSLSTVEDDSTSAPRTAGHLGASTAAPLTIPDPTLALTGLSSAPPLTLPARMSSTTAMSSLLSPQSVAVLASQPPPILVVEDSIVNGKILVSESRFVSGRSVSICKFTGNTQ